MNSIVVCECKDGRQKLFSQHAEENHVQQVLKRSQLLLQNAPVLHE